MRLEFYPAAALELSEAAQYYETRLAGLGRDFNVEARRIGAVACETPRIGKPLDKVHRKMSFHRFPVAFIYRIDGEAV
jgi:hypothetical protein